MPNYLQHSRIAHLVRRQARPTLYLILLLLIVIFPSLMVGLFVNPLPIQAQASPAVRISQFYGGGGNSGATLQSDFIELFNSGPDPVKLTGWSVQYAAKTGTTWAVTPLGDVTIAGYGYVLVKEASGAKGSDDGSALAAPDVVGATKLSAQDAKVTLVASEAASAAKVMPPWSILSAMVRPMKMKVAHPRPARQ